MKPRNPWISRNVAAIEISAIKTMAIRGAKVEGAASLTWGLPSFRTPEPIRRAVAEQLEADPEIGKYALPDGLPALRAAVAREHRAQTGIEVDPDRNVMITAGNMQGVNALLHVVLDPGVTKVRHAARELGDRFRAVRVYDPQRAVVLEEGTPPAIVRAIETSGGRVSISGTRRAEMERAMREHGAVFGGGSSGRFWYVDAGPPLPDALVTLTLLLGGATAEPDREDHEERRDQQAEPGLRATHLLDGQEHRPPFSPVLRRCQLSASALLRPSQPGRCTRSGSQSPATKKDQLPAPSMPRR